MDLKESLDKLSNSDKIRLLSIFTGHIYSSVSNQDETSERSNINIFLENLKKALAVNSYESSLPEENTRKKQKTLDSWLIRRKDGVSPRKEVGQLSSSCTEQSSANSTSCNMSEVSSQSEHISVNSDNDAVFVSNVSEKSKLSKKSSKVANKCETDKNVPVNNKHTASSREDERDRITNEKYNLRSKRKDSEPISEVGESNVKNFKNIGDHQDIPNADGYDKILDNALTNSYDFSHRSAAEENNSCSIDNTLKKKNCNLRAKKKNSKLVQSTKLNNILTQQSKSNSQITDPVTNRNETFLNITSNPKSNHDAFCLLNNECSKLGLNIMDIMEHEKIQILLNNHKILNSDAIVFIGSCKSKTEKKLPVVHLSQSRKILQEKLSEL